ncbi:family 43 glycosylhydrolase [Pedobacter alpinus]|uniref:Family 43 glycosylhydrolase n=1 Tax=Pedobacter alpinus TaxID=1590643 RepID=A0ABW5TW83_9SPHI
MKTSIKYSLQLFIVFLIANNVLGQNLNIKNDTFWNTADGKPLYSQGGGIFKFKDPKTGLQKYFWYGVQYKEADIYRHNPAVTNKNASFQSVTCYSSTDLVNWVFEGDVLTEQQLFNNRKPTWVGRLGVAYLKEQNKYAMVIQLGNKVLFAVAGTPTETFKYQQEIDMTSMIGTSNTGDQTVFTDEDTGKSYLVYSYGNGRNKIYISEIGLKDGMVNLLDCNKIFEGESREGNCLFKYKNKFYMSASNIYGWDGSFAYYLVADNILGPYMPTNNMQIMDGCTEDFAHVSQTGFFYTVKGTAQETVIYCGDRWSNFAGNGLGYNQWVPLSFTGVKPYFNSISSWSLNEKTGNWKVNDDNNYVKNGSFEADRRSIPSKVKPLQQQLTGWASKVIKGNSINLDSAISPQLNHFNNTIDRKTVIGEKSLNISDKVNFKRIVTQVIESSPYVKLHDGKYVLTAKVKNSAGFSKLSMFAISNGKLISYIIKEENKSWKTVTIDNISVSGGRVEIGFKADAKANSFCYIDDVSLVKMGTN